jgi:hypothetical protein
MAMIFLGAAHDASGGGLFAGNAVSAPPRSASADLARRLPAACQQAASFFVLCGRIEREFAGVTVPEPSGPPVPRR